MYINESSFKKHFHKMKEVIKDVGKHGIKY